MSTSKDTTAVETSTQPVDAPATADIAAGSEPTIPSASNDETTAVNNKATSQQTEDAESVPNADLKGKQKEETPAAQSTEKDDDGAIAIGPAQDEIKAPAAEPNSPPVCNITLLLTTGSRHPYKLDAKYLTRRNVVVPETTEAGHPDPFSISIYTLKELILREWRNDWEAKPASPSSIRLIHFGKLLDDKEPLKSMPYHHNSP